MDLSLLTASICNPNLMICLCQMRFITHFNIPMTTMHSMSAVYKRTIKVHQEFVYIWIKMWYVVHLNVAFCFQFLSFFFLSFLMGIKSFLFHRIVRYSIEFYSKLHKTDKITPGNWNDNTYKKRASTVDATVLNHLVFTPTHCAYCLNPQ